MKRLSSLGPNQRIGIGGIIILSRAGIRSDIHLRQGLLVIDDTRELTPP